MDARTTPIARACEIAGGQARLARQLRITAAAVNQWCKGTRTVPAGRCPDIERATGGAVRCEELRPDVSWVVLRKRRQPAKSTEGVN